MKNTDRDTTGLLLIYGSSIFGTIASATKSEGIVDGQGFERLIVEKPFGTDLETASPAPAKNWKETFDGQIFQVLRSKKWSKISLPFRFRLSHFDNLWNRDFIDNNQITFAERWVLKERIGYYGTQGPFEDMVQNTLFSFVFALLHRTIATFTKDAIRAEKLSFGTVHNPTDEELRNSLSVVQPFENDRRKKRYLLSQWPNVNLSLLQTYASGAFFVLDRFRGVPLTSAAGSLDTKRNHGQYGFPSKPTPSLDIACNKCLDHLYPTKQVSREHQLREKGRRNNSTIATRFPLITKQCDCNWSFPNLMKN